jgi:hypothetical protein
MGRPPGLPSVPPAPFAATQRTAATGARTLTRDYDGQVRAVERRDKTQAAAERALKLALRDRARVSARGHITADSRVSVLADAWYAGLTGLSPRTTEAYRDRLDRQILPGLGQLRIR